MGVMRAYTPTSSDDDVGYFDLVVKVYFAGVHPKFPDGGVLSQHFDKMQIGDEIEAKGPIGHVTYNGRGNFLIHGKETKLSEVGLICGGAGITPAYQIIKAITKGKETKLSEVGLICGGTGIPPAYQIIKAITKDK